MTVLNVIPKHLEATIAKLLEIGCEVEEFDDAVRVVSKGGSHQYTCKDSCHIRDSRQICSHRLVLRLLFVKGQV